MIFPGRNWNTQPIPISHWYLKTNTTKESLLAWTIPVAEVHRYVQQWTHRLYSIQTPYPTGQCDFLHVLQESIFFSPPPPTPTEEFVTLYLELLDDMSMDSELFDQIRNEVLTLEIQRHDPVFVKALIDEWNDVYIYMHNHMNIETITLLLGFLSDIQPVLHRLRLYEICAIDNMASSLFHPVNRIMWAANNCVTPSCVRW